jgi:hypothetical protein
MKKVIIENRTKRSMVEAVEYVTQVMNRGKISETSKGPQYCFCTVWPDGLTIYADRNKKSYKFIVTERLI